MADYRIQLTATEGTWVGDEAFTELTARVIKRNNKVPDPQGQFVVFDPGEHKRVINARGNALLTIKFTAPRIAKYTASLESDLDVFDETNVVIPQKPKEEKSKPKKLAKPKISLEGSRGNKWLHAYVTYEDGIPAEGEIVNVTAFAGGHRIMSDDFPVNARGIVEQRIRISAAGTKLIVRVHDHEEEFDYLEQIPPSPMTYGQRLSIIAGSVILVATVVYSLFRTTAP